jgi:cytochrome c oxidase subunit II
LLVLLVAGCAQSQPQATSLSSASAVIAPATSSGAPDDSALANGKAIFLTGVDLKGARITASPAPLMSSCVGCHHADGSGGVHLPGGAVSADLRYTTLVTNQHPPYTIPLLERTISKGIDNTGQPLNRVMPRWHMSPTDLHDVAQYVLTNFK